MRPPSRRIQAVAFDAVGTLIHLREPVGVTYARFAREHGVELPTDRIAEAFGRVLAGAGPNVHPGVPMAQAVMLERDWWRQVVRGTFRAADGMARFDDFDGFFELLWNHYSDAAAWQLDKQAEPTLAVLRDQELSLAIISNFDQRLRSLLQQLGIHELFRTVTLPADAGAAKPDRAIFDVCLKRLGLAGHRAAYVGDRAREDIAGSRDAGLHPIDVASLATLAELPARLAALEDA